MHAVQAATPAVWGVILQFPFYAGIAGIITATHLNERLADAFVGVSTPTTFPAVVAVYSAVLGVFVPVRRIEVGDRGAVRDGGGPRPQGAPRAGWWRPTISARRSRTWCSRSGCCRSSALFQLRARDVMGYTFVVFLALVPVVLLLVTLLGATLPYPL